MPVVRLAVASLATAALIAAGGGAYRATLTAPTTTPAGLPITAVVRVSPTPPVGAVSIHATWAGHHVSFPAVKAGAVYRARVELPSAPARWTLTARVAGAALASRALTVVKPAVRHPYAVVVDPRGRVFVADGAARRIVLVSPRTGGRSVHATGLDEPTGLAATRNALYVADFNAGLVRRVDAAGRVTTLARLPAGDRSRGLAREHRLRGDDGRDPGADLGRRPDHADPGSRRARPAARSHVRPRRRHSRRRGLAAGPADRSGERGGPSSSSTASTPTGSRSPATGPSSSPAAARRAAASAGSSPAGSRRSCSRTSTSATSPSFRTAT